MAGTAGGADEPRPPVQPAGAPERLDERRVVELALGNGLPIRLGLLGRESDRYAFRVARGQYEPVVGVGASIGTRRNNTRPLEGDASLAEAETVGIQPTLSWYVPTGGTFSYNWNATYSQSSASRMPGPAQRDARWGALGWTVGFSQPLLRGGGLTVGTASFRQAKIADQVSRLSFRNTVMTTVTTALISWRAFVQAREAEIIATRSYERGKELATVTRDLVSLGRVATSELTQAEADMANRELALITARNSLDSSRLQLARALDLPTSSQFETDLARDIPQVTPVYSQVVEVALRQRPDFLTASIALQSVELAMALAKNNQLWDLNLVSSYSETVSGERRTASWSRFRAGLSRPDADEFFAGLTVNIPIWGNYSQRQGLVGAKVASRQAALTHENLKRSIESELLDQVRSVDVAWRSLQLARQARMLSEKSREDEQIRLSSGLSTTMSIVRLEDAVVAAQNQELTAVISYLNALTALDQASGTTLIRWNISIDESGGAPPRVDDKPKSNSSP